ncbi:MAG: lytic murein transglycosylase [Alphaproteobacteria bacterium]|nr:lytic murein transglycosylase [Alphaproteobacteria bacterium]
MLLLIGLAGGNDLARADTDFATWLADFRAEARAAGLSDATIDRALAGMSPNRRVLELDRHQPEFTRTFWEYLDNAISPERIAEGRRQLAANADLLAAIRARYGVQPRFLVALWGLETGYGSFLGDFPVPQALATLAYGSRRADMFRSQLIDALSLIEAGDISPGRMRGSWAGAMGQVQFMPSTYRRFAVDFDDDGRRDLWSSVPDALASGAHYLSEIGWRGDETWGREVRLPEDFPWVLADLSLELPLAEWQRHGVRRTDGRELPQADLTASLILPMGHQGPAFLVYDNFRAIMTWNNSSYYALAVGHLADRLAGGGPLQGPRPAIGRSLRFQEVTELQTLLAALGYDPGEADGLTGPRTRRALRSFQTEIGVPADGFPTLDILGRLRTAQNGYSAR